MAQAARHHYDSYEYGYAYDSRVPRAAQPQRKSRPDVRVIPGRRSENPALQAISPELAHAFKIALVVIAAIAVLCAARVWLSASTVSMLEQANALESTLVTAQATTNELEIQHSILASSARIEEEAAKLGMFAPESVKYLKVAIPGRVITNSDGSISLAGTIRNIEECSASAKI